MGLEPKVFFNFAADHYALLLNIYEQGRDLSEAEIYDYINANTKENSNRPEYIFSQLSNLKIIQVTPEATTYYEITYHVRDLLSVLEQEHRFTSTKEIQAYLEEIDSLRQQLDIAFKENKYGVINNILDGMAILTERLRQSSNGNRMAIIREVQKVKLNKEKQSSENRFDKILDIYNRYITPLQDMIEVDKSLDKGLQQLQVMLQFAEKKYEFERDILYKIRRVSLHLPRLRSDLKDNFKDSTDEITPLLEKLQANLFGRGVTRLLRQVSKRGGKTLDEIAEKLSLPPTIIKTNIFDDNKTKEFLISAKGYKPYPPPVVNHDDNHVEDVDIVNPRKLIAEFSNHVPNSDALEWLKLHYGDKELKTILIMYKKLFESAHIYEFEDEQKRYSIDNFYIRAHPLQIKELNLDGQ